MSGQIFINYRHDDDAAQAAGGLYDWLSARFPQNKVFLDDDKTNPGIDYAAVIESNAGPRDVLVVVIGKRWLSSADDQGGRRLDDPEDFVRLQTGIALKRGIAVIPVLVDGASMPRPDEVPENLKALVRRQALAVSQERLRADAERLAGAVEQALESAGTELQRKHEEQAAGANLPSQHTERPARLVKADQISSKTGGANPANPWRPLVVVGTGVAIVLVNLSLLFNASRPHLNPSRPQSVSTGEKPLAIPSPSAAASNSPNPIPLVREASPSPTASVRQALTSPTPPSVADWLAEAERYLDAKDYAQALPLLRKAAETDKAEALNQLGELYYSGHGVTQDYGRARQWFQKAAAAGNTNAMYRLGELYQYGQGVARDYAQARRWYQEAVDAGNADGMNGLGRLYENGRGVARDYAQARQWYQRAVDAGNAQGMVNLGSLYEGDAAQDYAQARQWYQKAADAGNTNAMYHLGLLYQYGLSVARDYAQARQWYQKTVDGGNAQGMVNLGSLYEDGLGVSQDYVQAREWYQKAADAGHPGGMNGLGRLYQNGRGVPQDYAQARHWYQKAVEAGSVAAMEHLGNMYYYGHGIAQDHTKAREWYQKAVDGGWPVVLLPKD
jgi:TPR repeat protein